MELIDELRSLPIREDLEIVNGRYSRDKTAAWHTLIPNISVDRNDPRYSEPLVPVTEGELLFSNYYLEQHPQAWRDEIASFVEPVVRLRRSIVQSLAKVDTWLRPFQMRLIVQSGYRSKRLQEEIRKIAIREKGRELTERLFADPSVYAPHSSGGAVDLEVYLEKEKRLLPTKWKGMIARHVVEALGAQDPALEEVKANRRLIHHLLTGEVVLAKAERFVPHPYEYWHYGRNERLSGFFAHEVGDQHPVWYDEIVEIK